MVAIETDRDSQTELFLFEDAQPDLKKQKRRSWSVDFLIRATNTLLQRKQEYEYHHVNANNTDSTGAQPGIIGKVFRYPPPKLEAGRKETAWLDGMRGVAAFLVMLFHYDGGIRGIQHEAPYLAPELAIDSKVDLSWQILHLPILRFFFVSGHTQVSIFFVLSGFVLAWSPLKALRGWNRSIRLGEQTSQSPRNNMLGDFTEILASLTFRRWLRLFLPCFLVGLISMMGLYFGMLHMIVPHQSNIFLQFWDYLKACEAFANPFHLYYEGKDSTHSYNMVMWTIPLEWAGSLLVFITLLSVARVKSFLARAVIVGTISLYACYSLTWHYWLFSTGFLLADCVLEMDGFENVTSTSFRGRVFWGLVLLIGLFLGGFPGYTIFYSRTGYEWIDNLTPTGWKVVEGGARFWWCVGAIFITTSVAHFQCLRTFLESDVSRYLGRISFMLYLIHNVTGEALGAPLLGFTKEWLGQKMYSELVKQEIVMVQGVFRNLVLYLSNVLILIPLAVFLASWLEVFVDAPCTRFARWLDRKITAL